MCVCAFELNFFYAIRTHTTHSFFMVLCGQHGMYTSFPPAPSPHSLLVLTVLLLATSPFLFSLPFAPAPSSPQVLLRFSFKESVYKAVHPFLERSVDFHEVEVYPQPDGTAQIRSQFKTGEEVYTLRLTLRLRSV
jgi:hypothetical protein